MFSAPLSITIIGFGAFGKLIASLLAPHASISVYDRSVRASELASALGFTVIERAEDIVGDLVILAVPVLSLEACALEIAPHLHEGQVIMDVCSIKEQPARIMCQTLPVHVEILSCHPMFGPQSAAGGIAGSQIVFCPIRGRRWRRVAAFLRRHFRLKVIVATPEEHDRQAAMTQGLTHLLARALVMLGSAPTIRTRSFELMSEALSLVANDGPDIFEAVTVGNRHVIPVRESLISALSSLGAPATTADAETDPSCKREEGS